MANTRIQDIANSDGIAETTRFVTDAAGGTRSTTLAKTRAAVLTPPSGNFRLSADGLTLELKGDDGLFYPLTVVVVDSVATLSLGTGGA